MACMIALQHYIMMPIMHGRNHKAKIGMLKFFHELRPPSDMGARVTVSGDLLSGNNNVTATANHGKQHSLTHHEASKWFD